MVKVISADGTSIAYDQIGQGQPLMLVAGASGTRHSWGQLPALLAKQFAVITYDRRGRGDSGDTLPFALDREIEDIVAIIDATGGTAFVHGMSSGACLTLEAAAKAPTKFKKLSVYEAPYDDSPSAAAPWHEYLAGLKGDLHRHDYSAAVTRFMKLVGVPENQVEDFKSQPFWPALEAIAPTLEYDAIAMGADRRVPRDRFRSIQVPSLVMDGAASANTMPFMAATANTLGRVLPNARRKTLPGQTHDVDATVLAPALAHFFG